MTTSSSCLQIEIVSQISCLIAMTAELCCGTVSMDTISLPLDNLPLKASVFASQLSHRIKGKIITVRVRSTTGRYCFHRWLSLHRGGGQAMGGGTPDLTWMGYPPPPKWADGGGGTPDRLCLDRLWRGQYPFCGFAQEDFIFKLFCGARNVLWFKKKNHNCRKTFCHYLKSFLHQAGSL